MYERFPTTGGTEKEYMRDAGKMAYCYTYDVGFIVKSPLPNPDHAAPGGWQRPGITDIMEFFVHETSCLYTTVQSKPWRSYSIAAPGPHLPCPSLNADYAKSLDEIKRIYNPPISESNYSQQASYSLSR